MSDSFEEIREEFLAETEDTLAELQHDLDRLGRHGGGATEIVDRIFRTTHSLKGLAGMFGLDGMSAVSHAMENVLEDLRAGRREFDGTLLDVLHEGVETLHRLLGLARAGSPGAGPDASAPVLDKIRRLLGSDPGEAVSSRPEFMDTLGRLSEAQREQLADAARSGRTVCIVQATLSPDDPEEHLLFLQHEVEEWGTVHGLVGGESADTETIGEIRLVASGSEGMFRLLQRVGLRTGRTCTPSTRSI